MSLAANLKNLIYGGAWALGLPRLYHRFYQRGAVGVVMYHAVTREPLAVDDWCFVSEAVFRRHVDFYRRHFEVLHLEEAVDRLKRGAIRRPTLCITFDDGYANNHEVAYPILREAGLPATIFLTTSLIGTGRTVWFCRLNQALAETRATELRWQDTHWGLATPEDRAAASVQIQAQLKQMAPAELNLQLGRLVEALGVARAEEAGAGSPYRMLERRAILEMQESGLIRFGAHNHDHLILSTLFPRERRAQIEQSVAEVADLTGRPCRLYAYPNGRSEDFNTEDVATLRALGVEVACTTRSHPNHRDTPTLELGRYGIEESLSMPHLAMLTHHLLPAMREGAGRTLGE